MAQATLSQPSRPSTARIPSSVASKLRGLRAKIKFWLLIDGLSRVLAAAVILLLVNFLVDYWLDLDFKMRLINLVISVTILGYMIYRGLILPLSARVSDDALILAVEKHYGPELGERLISAVQFSRMSDDIELKGVSPQLVKATIEDGTQAADRLPFGAVVDTRWLTANLAIFAIGTIALGLYAYGASAFRDEGFKNQDVNIAGRAYPKQLVGIGFDREVLLKETPWPQDVYFTLNVGTEGNVIVVPRGDDLKLIIRVHKDSKHTADDIDEVVVDFDGPTGQYTETADVIREKGAVPSGAGDDATEAGADDDENSDEAATANKAPMPVDYFAIEMANVLEEFTFQIRARGVRGNSPVYTVKLVDRPELQDRKLIVKLPQYAGAESSELPPGAGPHHILAGSSLTIEGGANKPLQRAEITVGDHTEKIDCDGKTKFTHTISADVLANQLKSGAIGIVLYDTEDLVLPTQPQGGPLKSVPPAQFSLRIKPDRAPEVLAKLDGISGMVTPTASIPIVCQIKDEFAIDKVTLTHTWRDEETKEDQPETQGEIDEAKEQIGKPLIRFREKFNLEPLELSAGATLRFWITATDNNDISGPGVGKSTEFLLRVVTEADLRDQIVRMQAEQRIEFERLYKQQQLMKDDTLVLQAASRDAPSLTSEQRNELRELQKNHKLLETNIGSVAKRLEDILREMKNNRLDETETELVRKLQENIITPMKELANGDVNETIKQLDGIRDASDKLPQREEAMTEALAKQDLTLDKMEEILRHMAKTEDYQEAVNLFYAILKEAEKVEKMTEEERQRLIQELLEGGKKPE